MAKAFIGTSGWNLPSEAAFQSWRTQVPQGRVFAVKASRLLTHIKRLKDPEEPKFAMRLGWFVCAGRPERGLKPATTFADYRRQR